MYVAKLIARIATLCRSRSFCIVTINIYTLLIMRFSDYGDPLITLEIFLIEIVDAGPADPNAAECITLSRNVTLPMHGHKAKTDERIFVFWGHIQAKM